MEDNYTYLTSKMDFSGFQTMSWDELLELAQTRLYFSKGHLSKIVIPDDVTFDTALPQPWLDALCAFHELTSTERDSFVSTTFMLYAPKRKIQEFPWSAIKEHNKLIKQFMNGEKRRARTLAGVFLEYLEEKENKS